MAGQAARIEAPFNRARACTRGVMRALARLSHRRGWCAARNRRRLRQGPLFQGRHAIARLVWTGWCKRRQRTSAYGSAQPAESESREQRYIPRPAEP
jgi:hypothetical protein